MDLGFSNGGGFDRRPPTLVYTKEELLKYRNSPLALVKPKTDNGNFSCWKGENNDGKVSLKDAHKLAVVKNADAEPTGSRVSIVWGLLTTILYNIIHMYISYICT